MTWLGDQAAKRKAAGVQRTLRARTAGEPRVDVASNDYLGLATDPDVVAAGVEALQLWGAGATGSRLVTGHTELHAGLELTLARLLQAPRCLVFSSGYLANLAAITALSDRETLILSDAYNHASIIDACRLSRGHVQIYPNRDVASVRQLLTDNPMPRALIVTDAVFSVDGDVAPLAALAEVADEFGATLIVDEAHSVGVLADGAGACVAAGVDGANVVRTLTLSKSLGSQGGGVAASDEVVEHLISTARSFIFDTGLAPAAAGSALAAADKILARPELPQRALAAAGRLDDIARQSGWTVNPHDAAVVALPVGSAQDAVLAAEVCAQHGVDVGCFRPPSVPDGIARLRLTAHATLAEDDFEVVGKALAAARDKVTA